MKFLQKLINLSLPPFPLPSLWPCHPFCSLTSEPEFSLGVQCTRVLIPQISMPPIRPPLNLHSDVSSSRTSPAQSCHLLPLIHLFPKHKETHIFTIEIVYDVNPLETTFRRASVCVCPVLCHISTAKDRALHVCVCMWEGHGSLHIFCISE